MRLIITLLFLIITNCAFAQKHNEAYENLSIGWTKMYKYKGFTKSSQVDEKKYSIAQLSVIDSFANWMQASYYPKGSLGDIKKYVTPKKNLYHERYNEAIPHSYGANACSYTFLRPTNGKWQPYLNFSNNWTIAANEIPLDNREIDFNINKACLFSLPVYDEQYIKEYPDSDEAKTRKLYAVSSHPLIKKYICLNLKPAKTPGVHHLIILSKNNRLPFLQVTIGEALQFAEDAFPIKYAEQKKTAIEQNSYNATHLKSAMEALDNKFNTAKATIAKLREKYKNRLNEKAYLRGSYSIQDLTNGADIFTNGDAKPDGSFSKNNPLYRIDPEMQAKCSTDRPQWIAIKWYGGRMDEIPYKHMHESILSNFDFDYVYNFFFDPEKVKGKQYKPLGPLEREEINVTTEKSSAANKSATDPSILFFEDFSENGTGQKPMGWKTSMNNNAQYPVVTTLKNREGKWLEFIGHSPVTPQTMNYPLPQNFEMSFDVAVPKDIPWGAKAFELYLGTKNSFDDMASPALKLRVRAGFWGRPGEVSIEGKFSAGFFTNVKPYYEATGFSNDKEINTVKIILKKKGESLELFIDKAKIADIPKAFPAATTFNWLQFMHSRSDGDTEKYYISDIKIIKG